MFGSLHLIFFWGKRVIISEEIFSFVFLTWINVNFSAWSTNVRKNFSLDAEIKTKVICFAKEGPMLVSSWAAPRSQAESSTVYTEMKLRSVATRILNALSE